VHHHTSFVRSAPDIEVAMAALAQKPNSGLIVAPEAKDVRATLIRAFADVKAISPEAAERCVAAIERERRYLQDTY
jgi:hypothetical protein